MKKVFITTALTLFATQALAGSFPSPTLYPSFSNAHGRATSTTFSVHGESITVPTAINADGVIVGASQTDFAHKGFIRAADGTITKFILTNASARKRGGISPNAINGAGDIAGSYTGKEITHGFLRSADGATVSFDATATTNTEALGINASDTIVGFYAEQPTNTTRGFVRTSDGTITAFDVPGAVRGKPGVGTVPVSINDAGTVAGYYSASTKKLRGFVRTAAGVITKFGVHNSSSVSVRAINASGTIAGTFTNDAGAFVGFLRDPNGVITIIKVPGAGSKGGDGTVLNGLDDAGDVVGWYNKGGRTIGAFLRTADGTVTPIDLGDGSVAIPSAINATGTVTGYASVTGGTEGFAWHN